MMICSFRQPELVVMACVYCNHTIPLCCSAEFPTAKTSWGIFDAMSCNKVARRASTIFGLIHPLLGNSIVIGLKTSVKSKPFNLM